MQSTVVVHCQADRRTIARRVATERFEWMIVGVDQDESMLELLRRLPISGTGTTYLRIAGLGDRGDEARCERFTRRGCTVYLDGDREHDDVIRVLELAARYDVSIIDSCFAPSRSRPGSAEPLAALTKTETSVVRLMMRGQSNSEMAKTQGVAISTIESHVRNILYKLSARNRTQAAERARALGL